MTADQQQLGFELDERLVVGSVGARTGRGRRGPARATTPAPQSQGQPSLPLDGPRRSAVEIARALGRPDPTPEQVAVIEAPVEPLLVVAGAGSGKTETMAARVVWLVANGHVASEEILGLTFTRKAAGELADRIRSRLRALHRRGVVDEEPQPVTVSTYHAYAAAVLSDHGLRVGIEPGSRLLGEAGAWQLAAEVVERWDGDMSGVDHVAATVTEAVLALAGECAEHLVEPVAVAAHVEGVLDRATGLPAELGTVGPGAPKAGVRDRLVRLAAKRRLVPLVEAYVERKRALDVLDFGDQVALAARIASEVPQVAVGEQARFRVVLLDEYQDTSHGQLVLLRALFGDGHPVTAVGDPHQSIYGWRGASAGNLQRFPTDFPHADGAPSACTALSTSWRNDTAVLAVANRVAADLQVPPRWARSLAHVDVPPLVARPQAGPGRVVLGWFATLEDEARAVAEVVETQWRGPAGADGSARPDRPTAAVLCRARALFPVVEAALRARGLPVEVVGLGGLLSVPEVADVRAALEVLHDPTRGDSLMRLLTGPALRLGPRDLEALGAWAAELARRRHRAAGVGTADGRPGQVAHEVVADVVDERSVVEALDELPARGWQGPAGQALSGPGRRRLDRLGATLRDLRGRRSLPLADLVLDVERALLLDIEVAARPGVRPGTARAHLDAFVDVAAGFADSSGGPGGHGSANGGSALGAFLAWLHAADTRERGLETPVTEVREDAVQVLTVHAAKGLEWDVVAVTGLVEGTFPSGVNGRAPGPSNGWLGEIGALPYPLRGDAAGLPRWDVEGAPTQAELAARLEEFRERCGLHDVAEERRLAYVAVTRARRLLLMTGAQWGDGSRPRTASRFLQEAGDLVGQGGVEILEWTPAAQDGVANPRDALVARADWPLDPLGPRRPAVADGADRVLAALDTARADGPTVDVRDEAGAGWAREVALLLAERDATTRRDLEVILPTHLSASRVVALATDPDRLAARLRRPMPEPPNPHARRGSAFHAWLEQRFGAAALVDVDDLPGAADDAAGDAGLVALQDAFLASEWAHRTPEAVEVSIETPVEGVVLRGRVDAVFRLPDDADGTPGWEVVDWKTGPPPGPDDGAAARARAVQLAVYRLAWARLQGVPVDRVRAAFFHAATGATVRPVDLLDETGLAALVTAATEQPVG